MLDTDDESFKTALHDTIGAIQGEFEVKADGIVMLRREMMTFFGASVDQNNWTRDWRDLWASLRKVIEEVDVQARQPLWQVIHSEKDQEAA